MKLLYNWPLIFLIFIPIIILLYLLKQKAEDQPISSLYLWKEAMKNIEASNPWEKLRNNLLMYLQIFTMLALIFALAAPYLTGMGKDFKNIVVVIDNSGSMNASYDGKISRLELSKKKAIEYLDDTRKNVQVTVISSAKNAKVELASNVDKSKAKEAIINIKSTDLEGNLTPSLSLVSSLAAGWEKYEAVMFSDSGANISNISGYIVDVSSVGPNGGLEYVNHRITEEGTVKVLTKCTNFGQEVISTDINLYVNNKLIDIKPVSLKSGESKTIYFDDISADKASKLLDNNGVIRAEINEKDYLEADNVAYDRLGKNLNKRVLLVSKQNLFLEKALMSTPNLEVFKTTDIAHITEDNSFDLYIFDGIQPKEWPSKGNIIYINPTKSTEEFIVEKTVKNVWLKTIKHNVTDYLEGYTFGVSQLKAIKKPIWAKSFLRYQEYSGGFIGNVKGRTVAVIAFDIHQSDLPLQTQFPILVHNLMEQAVKKNLVSNPVVTTGEQILINSAGKNEKITLKNPQGTLIKIPSSSVNIYYNDTDQSGVYTVTQKIGKETVEDSFIVTYPKAESSLKTNIKTTVSQDNQGKKVSIKDVKGNMNLRNYLIMAILVLLLVEWIIYVKQKVKTRNIWRKYGIIAIRCFIVLLVLLALAGLSITYKKSERATIFLIDVSDSMKSHKQEAIEFTKNALKTKSPKDKAGIIVFGADTKVEQFLSNKNIFAEMETKPITTATNLEKAVQAAIALFPDYSEKQLVLLTDGNENEGSINKMSPSLVNNQVAVQVVKINDSIPKEVYLSNVTIPGKINMGDTFPVEVEIQSNVKTGATLSLYAGTELKSKETVQLQKGVNQFVFKDKQTQAGIRGYRVTIEAQEDTEKVNNEYVAFTQAEKGKTILLIEGSPNNASQFEKVLDAGNVLYEKIRPQSAPSSIIQLNAYKSIVMVDVHKDDLPDKFLGILDTYVKDYGGGFIATGGENSFALGNYKNTVLEKVLPVKMDIKGKDEIPETAVALVIDHSGSMSNGNGTYTKLDLAKESAVAALTNLRKIDSLGVVAFDDSYSWVVPMRNADNVTDIEDRIYSINLGGGTSIYPALNEAYKKLDNYNAKIKHIILLTDGQDGFREYDDLLEKMKDKQITLSTVAVGSDSDQMTLGYLAEEGQGRYYFTDIDTDIPRIFAKEVLLSMDTYLVNGEFTPAQTSNSEILEGVSEKGLPTMLGYVASTKKDLATVHLVSEKEDPILTTWQYGLGKTVAFNTDVQNKWTANYAGFNNYPVFWKNIIDWTIGDDSDGGNDVDISYEGNSANIKYSAKEYGEDTQVSGVYTDEEGKRREIYLDATAPGIFETKISLGETGVYGVQITQKNKGKVTDSQNTAMALQYSKEYQLLKENEAFDDFIQETKGKKITKPKQVFAGITNQVVSKKSLTNLFLTLACILFMLDIANRRLHFKWFDRISIRDTVSVEKRTSGKKPKPEESKSKKVKLEDKPKEKSKDKPKVEERQMLDTSALLDKMKKR